MSFDRSDRSPDELPSFRQPAESPPGQTPDTPDVHRTSDASRPGDMSRRLPTKEERIAAYWRNRQTVEAAEAAYAGSHRADGGTPDATAKPGEQPRREPEPAQEAESKDRGTDDRTIESADKLSATEKALLKRVADLEADKASLGRQLAARDAKIDEQARVVAKQDERIDRLEAYVGQITTAVRELRQTQAETPHSTEIAGRFRDSDAEAAAWRKPQRKRHLPTDAMNNVISIVAGGVVTDLAYHLRNLSPEVAGLGASAAALGSGIIAVLRDRRKTEKDADHRSED